MHAPVPRGGMQSAPQAPQLVALPAVLVSHPLAGLPSQSLNPTSQVYAHVPALQALVECARASQACPHAPQWKTSVKVLVSQPLLAMESQSPYGTVHAPMAHRLLRHAGVALTAVQRKSHRPQLARLVVMSTQAPLQHDCPPGQPRVSVQPVTQRLPTQRLPVGQWSSVTH